MTSPCPSGGWCPHARPYTHFERPPASDAVEPPEAHGVARDGVKLMIVTAGSPTSASTSPPVTFWS